MGTEEKEKEKEKAMEMEMEMEMTDSLAELHASELCSAHRVRPQTVWAKVGQRDERFGLAQQFEELDGFQRKQLGLLHEDLDHWRSSPGHLHHLGTSTPLEGTA